MTQEIKINWEELEKHYKHKKNVLAWFGDRGVDLEDKRTKGRLHLSKFKWVKGKLFYSIKGDADCWSDIEKTETGKIDMCCTHREDGSAIIVYEPYSSYFGGFKDIPKILKEVEENEKRWRSLGI